MIMANGQEVAETISDTIEAFTNSKMNEHNCHMHNNMVSCNKENQLKMKVENSKKRLYDVLMR